MRAYREGLEHGERFQAAMFANLINAWGPKRPVTVEQLLGIEKQGNWKSDDPEGAMQRILNKHERLRSEGKLKSAADIARMN